MPKFIASRDYTNPFESITIKEWLGAPPEFSESDIAETLYADVVVCGGGLAGVPAARAAAEAGAEVVLFEKCAGVQFRSSDFGILGGKLNERWGRTDLDPQEVVSVLMRDNCYRIKQSMLNYWAGHSGDDLDWYLEGVPSPLILDASVNAMNWSPPPGVDFCVEPGRRPTPAEYDVHADRYPCFQITARLLPNHGRVLKGNLALAEATGRCKVYFKTPVKSLLTENGRVTGVIAQTQDGRTVRALARRGVVLATGDYAGNRDMLYYYNPWNRYKDTMSTGVDPEGITANTGDGHRMALWIGAKMEDGPHACIAHTKGGAIGVAAFLQLNLRGERFMNEDCGSQQLDNQLSLQPGSCSWQFFDSEWHRQLKHMTPTHGIAYLDEQESQRHQVDEKIATAKKRGEFFEADTLDELIRLTGLPFDAARDSLSRYNTLAAGGKDTDFGKIPKRLFPLAVPPFCACKIKTPPMLCALGGLVSDELSRCYDYGDRPISGLYVAGNTQGNRFAVEYPTTVPGLSHSLALTFGRRAGLSAVEEL